MTEKVKIGNVEIGGGAPVVVQSMTNADTRDYSAVSAQIRALEKAGCGLIRLAVTDPQGLEVCKRLLSEAVVPLAADIQFDYRLAVQCCDLGFHKVRFNPGNVGGSRELGEIAAAVKRNGTAVRVGVNGGSLEKEFLDRYGNTPEALAESALKAVDTLEKLGVEKIIVSAKSSSVKKTVEVNRLLSQKTSRPLHIGVTESGLSEDGIIKSAIGIGSLLLDGIGDTIRVSLTDDPVREVETGYSILKAAGLLTVGVEIISCPTCSRCRYDMISFAKKVKERTAGLKKPVKIAVMGCVVNGPGEAKEADFGVAGGDGKAALFKKGKVVATVPFEDALDKLLKMVEEND